MTFHEYQHSVMRTWNPHLEARDSILNALLGLAGEIGELVDAYKKNMFHDRELPDEHIRKEIGDIQYYLAALAHLEGFPLEDIAIENIDKLMKRYPEGFVVGGGIRDDAENKSSR